MNATTDAGELTPAALIARIERLPHTPWHVRARMIVGTATFFDAFDLQVIAYVLPVLFVIGAVPGLLALVLRRLLRESARWLTTKGRLAEADKVIRQIEADAVRRGIALPPAAATPAVSDTVAAPTRWSELFEGIYL